MALILFMSLHKPVLPLCLDYIILHQPLFVYISTSATTHGMFVALSRTVFRRTARALLTRTRQNNIYFCFASVWYLSSQLPSFPLSINNNVMNIYCRANTETNAIHTYGNLRSKLHAIGLCMGTDAA